MALKALKKDLVATGLNQEELFTWMQNVTEVLNNLKSGNAVLGHPGVAIGSDADRIATGAFSYQIDGAVYTKTAVTAGTSPGTEVVPQAKYGAVALDIGTNGTLDAVSAPANATGYNSAALAVAALPTPEAGHARVGYVTVTKSDGAFTFDTTAFNASNVTTVFVQGPLSGALSSGSIKLTQG